MEGPQAEEMSARWVQASQDGLQPEGLLRVEGLQAEEMSAGWVQASQD